MLETYKEFFHCIVILYLELHQFRQWFMYLSAKGKLHFSLILNLKASRFLVKWYGKEGNSSFHGKNIKHYSEMGWLSCDCVLWVSGSDYLKEENNDF